LDRAFIHTQTAIDAVAYVLTAVLGLLLATSLRCARSSHCEALHSLDLKVPATDQRWVHVPDPLDLSRQHPVDVPQQRRVRRKVDVRLKRRRVDPEALTLDPILLDREPRQHIVDLPPTLDGDAILQSAQMSEVDHLAVVDPSEPAEVVAVIDPDDRPAKRLALENLTDHDADDRVGRDTRATSASLSVLRGQGRLKITMHEPENCRILIQNLGDRLVPGEVLVGDLQIRGLKVKLGLVIDLGTHQEASLCCRS